ncbi:hypothetical protein FNF27_02018 [Cafeteria roenbergensis]|uniref:IPT/TIG domain-containing protein n=1 Tax=Cafeteria roenbergensis TaxID=33653 RepID=A0A5A8EKK4_CAFRO|nr:hypothetical protein FNF27_02018 [Cafeteria roenbergensis]
MAGLGISHAWHCGASHARGRACGLESYRTSRRLLLSGLLVALLLPPAAQAASSCFVGGDTSSLLCCSGSSIAVDTDAGTITSPAFGTGAVTLTSTTATATVRTFTLDSIVISGATVTLSGERALRLVSRGGIALDQVVFNASPEVKTVSLSGCGAASTLSVAGTARLGGFNGGALESAAATYGTLAGSAPAVKSGGGKVKVRAGGAGGSHYGRGGQQGSSSLDFQAGAGLPYLKAASDALVGGSGGGGGSSSDKPGATHDCTGGSASTQSMAAVGGGGGGAIELEALDGNVWLGSQAALIADGGDVEYPLYGGAGAGGRIRIGVHGARVIGIVPGAQLAVRGGYVDPIYSDSDLTSDCSGSAKDPCYIGQTTNGGGGVIAFFNAGSGVATVRAASSVFDVRSGNYRCPSGTCMTCAGCGSATDGAVLFGQGSEVIQDTANAPSDLSDASPNPDVQCNTLTTSMTSPAAGSATASALHPGGGDTITVLVSMPPGVPSRRIDTTQRPRLFVGRFECPEASSSWVDVFGTSSSAADKATAKCASTAPGVGSGLNLTLTFAGSQAGVTEMISFRNAVGFAPPTVSGWVAPPPALRFTASSSALTGPSSPSFNITLAGSGFGGPANSDLVTVTIGGQPCAKVAVRNNSVVDCTAPPNVGSGHTVALTAGSQAAAGTLPSFSYAPPEVHQISLAPGFNASVGAAFSTSGGQTVTVRGFNFGARVWAASKSSAATAQLVSAAVTIAGQPCSNVQIASDRSLNCTTPKWGGKAQSLRVSIGGQAITATDSADTRLQRRAAAAAGPLADAEFHLGQVDGFAEARTVNFTSPAVTLATFPDSSATSVAGSASPLRLPTTGGDVRLSGSSFGAASGAPLPVVVWNGAALGTAAVSRTSDSSLTVTIPAGVGTQHSLVVLPSDGLSPTVQPNWFGVAYSKPTLSSLSTTAGLAQAGGTSLTVLGSNFGPASAPLPIVFVGPARCGSVTRGSGSLAHVQLTCAVPSGVGKDLAVTAEVGGQNATTALSASYAQPDVQGVSPTYAFAAQNGVVWDVNVTGAALGARPSHISDLRIGGATCPASALEWHSSKLVRCRGLPASAIQSGTSAVLLATQGYYAAQDVNFLVLGRPVFNIDPDFSTAPTASGGKMRLLASADSFGFATADVVSVEVGNENASSPGEFAFRYQCALPTRTASGVLECEMPPGVGAALHVRVTTRGKASNLFQSPGNRLWSYRPPAISSLSPASVTFSTNVTEYNFTIFGTNFGNPAEPPTEVKVGGFACPRFELVNSSELRCLGIPAPLGGAWLSTTVIVAVGGQVATSSVFSFSGAPRITGASPPTGPSAGGFNLTLAGAELGSSLSDIASVSVNGRRCLQEYFVSSEVVVCTAPPGVGIDLPLRLVSSSGVSVQLDRAFSYAVPVLQFVSPSHLLTGDLMYNVTVAGTNLATALDVPELVIAGVRCPDVVVVNSSVVVCFGLSGADGWLGSAVALAHPAVSVRSADLLTAFGLPSVVAVSPPGGSVEGGDVIRIVGENFGRRLSEVASVTVGGRECELVSLVSSSIVQVRTPPGTGRVQAVVLTNIGGRATDATPATFSYDAPTVASISPDTVLSGPSLTYDFNISGTNLGNALDGPNARDVLVGGRPCSQARVVSSTLLQCTGINAGAGWQSADVAVTLGGQAAVAFGLVSAMPVPQVTTAAPSTIPTTGGVNLTIQGRGFGFQTRDILAVTVGGRECSPFELGEATSAAPVGSSVICRAPPGVGTLRAVVVSSRAGSESTPARLLSYAAPVITSAEPRKLLSGRLGVPFAYNLTIRGSGFGSHPEDAVESAVVAGRACPGVIRHNDSTLECQGLPAAGGWLGSDVAVTVGGQVGVKTAAVDAFQSPRVEAVSPASLAQSGVGGRRVAVVGSNFGTSTADIASVFLGLAECVDVALVSSTRLECTASNGTGQLLSVEVVNVAGGKSSENSLFSFASPAIESLSPGYVFLSASLTYDFVIRGTGFGLRPEDIVSVHVGDNPCSNVQWLSSTTLRCEGISGATWDSRSVVVEVRGYTATAASILRVYRQPTVQGVRPVSGPPSGQSSGTPSVVYIACSGCGEDPSDVVSASVGGQPCTTTRLLVDNAEVECGLPPGTGTGKNVAVVVRGGAASAQNSFFSYWGPVISSVSPSQLLAGSKALYNITVAGRHFGRDAAKLVVQLGGRQCEELVGPLTDTEDPSLDTVTCVGVQPSFFSTQSSTRSTVVVRVDSQTATQSGMLDVAPGPAITSLIPSTGPSTGGFNVTIKGPLNSFGFDASDLLGVELGDVATIKPPWVWWQSGSSLVATMPAGTGAGLAVKVLRRDGADQDAPGRFSYLGPGLVSVSPSQLLAGTSAVAYNLSIVGHGFGMPGSSNIALFVGGGSSVTVVHVNESSIIAVGVRPALFSADETAKRRLRVVVDGQEAVLEGALTVLGQPIVQIVRASGGSVAGGFRVDVSGEALAFAKGDIVALSVGDYPVDLTTVDLLTPSQLSFVAPRGVGSGLAVVLSRSDGATSVTGSQGRLTYSAPTLSTSSPSYLLPGPRHLNMTLNGDNLASRPADILALFIGPSQCPLVEVLPPSTVRCIGLVWDRAAATVVELRRADSTFYLQVPGLESQPLMSLSRAAPSVISTTGGTLVTLSGSGFGQSTLDIDQVKIGGQPAEVLSVALAGSCPSDRGHIVSSWP